MMLRDVLAFLQAAMKAAECRQQLNEATGAEPVLGELTVHLVMYLSTFS